MSSADQSREKLMALSMRRFQAVGSGDVDASMSVLIEEPVFELYPVGLKLSGNANVRRYYAHFFETAAPLIRFEPVETFFSETAIALELAIHYTPAAGATEPYRLLAIQPLQGDHFTGERLYGDERLFRIMFGGPIWSLLTPIGEA